MTRSGAVLALALAGCPVPDKPINDLRADLDQDGFAVVDGDCDDADADVGTSIEGWADDDGDGLGRGEAVAQSGCALDPGFVDDDSDCDDGDDAVLDTLVSFRDLDGDGAGTDETTADPGCQVPTGYSAASGDCDDTDPANFPGNAEICDRQDNDCDDLVDDYDEDDVVGQQVFPSDSDGDSYGSPDYNVVACFADSPYAADDTLDCDDINPAVNPDAVEICDNGEDDDCDELVDNLDLAVAYYPDLDGDGLGADAGVAYACDVPPGFVAVGGDCGDQDPFLGHESRAYTDADGDGYGDIDSTQVVPGCVPTPPLVALNGDCDDTEPTWYPGAEDVVGDDIDQSCDGVDGEDLDGDGDASIESLGLDCNDLDPNLPSPIDFGFIGGDQTCGLSPLVLESGSARVFNLVPPPSPHTSWVARSGVDLDGDGGDEVIVGAYASPVGTPDLIRVVFDATGAGDVLTYELPTTAAAMDRGTTQGALLDWNGDLAGDLAIIDGNGNDAVEGTLWLVAGPISAATTTETLPDVSTGNVHVIAGDPTTTGFQRWGFSMTTGDVLGNDGIDDLVITAPTLSYEEDRLYVIPGGAPLPASVTDPGAVVLYDPNVTVDGLGVGVAFTAYVDGAGAIALTSLGTTFDGNEVIVLASDDLVPGATMTASPAAWYETDDVPWSYDRAPTPAWGDMNGDGTADLVFGSPNADESTPSVVYVFDGAATSPAPLQADDEALFRLELPDRSCATALTVLDDADPVLVLGCTDWPLYTGTLLTVRAGELPASGVLDGTNTFQVVPQVPYWGYLAGSGITTGNLDGDGDDDVISSIYDGSGLGHMFAWFEAADLAP